MIIARGIISHKDAKDFQRLNAHRENKMNKSNEVLMFSLELSMQMQLFYMRRDNKVVLRL